MAYLGGRRRGSSCIATMGACFGLYRVEPFPAVVGSERKFTTCQVVAVGLRLPSRAWSVRLTMGSSAAGPGISGDMGWLWGYVGLNVMRSHPVTHEEQLAPLVVVGATCRPG